MPAVPDSSQPVARKMTRVVESGSSASSRAIAVAAATPEALSFAPGTSTPRSSRSAKRASPEARTAAEAPLASRAQRVRRCGSQGASGNGRRNERSELPQMRRDRRVKEEPTPRGVEMRDEDQGPAPRFTGLDRRHDVLGALAGRRGARTVRGGRRSRSAPRSSASLRRPRRLSAGATPWLHAKLDGPLNDSRKGSIPAFESSA